MDFETFKKELKPDFEIVSLDQVEVNIENKKELGYSYIIKDKSNLVLNVVVKSKNNEVISIETNKEDEYVKLLVSKYIN